jgi:hypothetical protein
MSARLQFHLGNSFLLVPSWQNKATKAQPVKSEGGDSFDVSEYVKNKSVEKLTVDKLKNVKYIFITILT